MKIKKKTFLNLLLIGLILSFFVTPLGDYSKMLLNRWFATAPTIIEEGRRARIKDYDWRLKDAQWDYFNFEKSKGHIVFINFWASWNLPSNAQLKDIQKLYDRYKGRMEFYIITDQERAPVEAFMASNPYTFPITYLVLGASSPLEVLPPPGTYILDENGFVAVHQNAISDWDNSTIYNFLDSQISGQ